MFLRGQADRWQSGTWAGGPVRERKGRRERRRAACMLVDAGLGSWADCNKADECIGMLTAR